MRRLVPLLILASCASPLEPPVRTAILVQNLTNAPLAISLRDATGTTPGASLEPFSRGCYAVTFHGTLSLVAAQEGSAWAIALGAETPGYHLDFDAVHNPLQPLPTAPC